MPLSHLTVIDFSTLGAAPQIAAFFGDFGARVIKVEHPRGDALRKIVDATGDPLQWKIVNRNKECITLDASRPAGAELLERLLFRADLLVANLTAERLVRFGLDRGALAKRHPRLVAVNLTAYGTAGPWAERAGSGTLAEAMSGLAALTGPPDAPPTLSPVGLGDYLGVLQGIIAALLGLYARDRARPERAADEAGVAAPGGELLDVAMYEPLLGLLAQRIAAAARDGVDPPRTGNRFPTVAPRNVYATADGRWVALTAGTDELAARTLQVIGRPELATDERFATNGARVAHVDQLDALIGAWIGARPCADVVAAFNAGRVSLAAVDPPTEVARNPHFHARGNLLDIADGAGSLTVVAPSPQRSTDPGRIRWLGRERGADNDAVYRDWLGLAADEIERLRADGTV